MNPLVTCFVGTYNRLETLDRTVRSFERFGDDVELVIVDNGTTDPRCKQLLTALKRRKNVRAVYMLGSSTTMEGLTDNFLTAIGDTLTKGTDARWLAVSESDICFDDCPEDTIRAYLRVAEHTGTAVGPHLRVDQFIPATYPLRSRVLATEARLEFRGEMDWVDDIPFSKCQTDTTFHLFPRDREFRRLHMDPVRCGPPYDAMHLDWYLNIFEPAPENDIYIRITKGESSVGSWGRQWLADYWHHFQDHGAASALEFLEGEPRTREDLCVNSFMLSWAYQYGIGCEPDRARSEQHLHDAIPYPHDVYWNRREEWMRMIYDNDFSSMGWGW